ncbi:hypothetical protein [Winogradskyella sp. PE311]|uniref:hypothetical protein n=1 Tax=Winogradskyella sp. PE311 TaxID=3366943 RepID=UPI00398156CA
MINGLQKFIAGYLNSEKQFPTLAAIASGLYPLLHYYSGNFLMVNSWPQFIWFFSIFIIIPILIFNIATFLVRTLLVFKPIKPYVLVGLNIFTFGILSLFITLGLTKKSILIIGLITVLLMILLYKHIKKVVLLQLILSALSLGFFIPKVISYLSYSDHWMQLTDDIDDTVLKEVPNIYVIQPDGYVNFSEVEKYPYGYDNSLFRTYLEDNNFSVYDQNRSNYFTTLTSNASMFAMKHHYYMNHLDPDKSHYDYRKGLAGDNNVINILKKNGYKTFMLLDYPYIIINRPNQVLDYINYDYNTMSYIGNQWKGKEPLDTLEYLIKINKETSNFFFIEKILPTHIENLKANSKGVEGERLSYLKRLEQSNIWLKETITTIIKQDSNGIIILVSDHGGYVGLESAEDLYAKIDDADLKRSIFSSLLAIKWSNHKMTNIDSEIKTNVNLFRVLFSHLSKNAFLLENREEDKSYISINNGSDKGVFEYFDGNNSSVFKIKE